jgi:hypothetical protein
VTYEGGVNTFPAFSSFIDVGSRRFFLVLIQFDYSLIIVLKSAIVRKSCASARAR